MWHYTELPNPGGGAGMRLCRRPVTLMMMSGGSQRLPNQSGGQVSSPRLQKLRCWIKEEAGCRVKSRAVQLLTGCLTRLQQPTQIFNCSATHHSLICYVKPLFILCSFFITYSATDGRSEVFALFVAIPSALFIRRFVEVPVGKLLCIFLVRLYSYFCFVFHTRQVDSEA